MQAMWLVMIKFVVIVSLTKWEQQVVPEPKGLRNVNHTQTLDLADIYERFFYEDNLIQRRISKKILMMKLMKVLRIQRPSSQPKNKGLVAKTFDWDEEEVSDEEEVTQVKVLMALADDELTVGKSHARNGEWVGNSLRMGMTKKWFQNPKTGLRDFNTGRILVLESQAVNESLKLTETSKCP
ncbi:hypothetical protein Tco_0481772 [Tanacetum coccineum]